MVSLMHFTLFSDSRQARPDWCDCGRHCETLYEPFRWNCCGRGMFRSKMWVRWKRYDSLCVTIRSFIFNPLLYKGSASEGGKESERGERRMTVTILPIYRRNFSFSFLISKTGGGNIDCGRFLWTKASSGSFAHGHGNGSGSRAACGSWRTGVRE